MVAWAGCFCYAAYYTGLDAVAGISAGTVAGSAVHAVVGRLFATGDELGRAGVYAPTVAACAVLLRRHGARVLPGAAVVLAACWSFAASHIFWPRGVFTMLGFALLTVASTRADAGPSAAGLTNP
ncbi:hypothetical protein [Streptomyces chiangmaiensis]|uniref:Uncharacterized protein n=1 Tax=Streptomyces chiangmaiensis TaxID=766497 RepID=A0ABU7FD21_9ACTN|nr:hypothetical protein [Streptomyces chiangmaiensis]MED7822066.1 hypothetical protein [Streptomyces chiangmaiensis]